MYASPLTTAILYDFGTTERDAIVDAYKHTQRLLCITGICLCVPLLAFALLLRDPRLGDEQSLPEAEGAAPVDASGSESDSSSEGDGKVHA